LNELVDELGLLVRHKLANQNIRLVRQLQPDLPVVLGDATQLETGVLNLILMPPRPCRTAARSPIKSRAVQTAQQPARTARGHGIQGHRPGHEPGSSAPGPSPPFWGTTKAKGTGLGSGHRRPHHRERIGDRSGFCHAPAAATTLRITLPVK